MMMALESGMVTPRYCFEDKIPSNSGSLSSVCLYLTSCGKMCHVCLQAVGKSVNNKTPIDASLKSEFNLINQMAVHTLALVLLSFWFGNLHGFDHASCYV